MMEQERIKKQKELVEKFGHYLDKEGFQPISGRIMGLLTVMDKEAYTFDEICQELNISKASASNAIKILEARDVIEYFTLPGDRKRYFRRKLVDSFTLVSHIQAKMKIFATISNEVLELKADKNSKISLFLKDVTEMMGFIDSKMVELREEYAKKEQNK